MYVVANRVPVAPAWQEEFEERFRTRAGQIDKQEGFVSMQVLRPADDDSPYVILTTWQDEAAFNNWVGSPDFRLAHQNPMPKEAFSGDGRIEKHDIIISATSSPAA